MSTLRDQSKERVSMARNMTNRDKKVLAPVEEKKKLNLDLERLKMDILSELGRNRNKKN